MTAESTLLPGENAADLAPAAGCSTATWRPATGSRRSSSSASPAMSGCASAAIAPRPPGTLASFGTNPSSSPVLKKTRSSSSAGVCWPIWPIPRRSSGPMPSVVQVTRRAWSWPWSARSPARLAAHTLPPANEHLQAPGVRREHDGYELVRLMGHYVGEHTTEYHVALVLLASLSVVHGFRAERRRFAEPVDADDDDAIDEADETAELWEVRPDFLDRTTWLVAKTIRPERPTRGGGRESAA